MEIQIYGGVNEIGGNKVFINAADKHFLFDFGLSFNDKNEFFSEFLNPRRYNGVIDYLYLKLLPSIHDFYRNDLVTPFADLLNRDPYNLTNSTKNVVDAFFLTHPHMDHYNFMGFLKQDTPFYLNWVSKAMLSYIRDTSINSDLNEILEYHESFKMVPKKRQKKDSDTVEYKRATKNDYSESETKRKLHNIFDFKPLNFKSNDGEISITQCPVDHSIPGSCSYIVEHDGVSFIYTGDFRRHGFHSEWVDDFIEKAKKANPVAIITEGTRVPSIERYSKGEYHDSEESEDDVRIRSRDMIRRHPGLVLVNFPIRNLDRVLLYYELAKKQNRVFAITPKMWYMIDTLRNAMGEQKEDVVQSFLDAYPLPKYDDENVAVYLPRKGWGRFEQADYRGFEQDIFDNLKYLTYKDIKSEPERYLLYLDFFMLKEIIDIDPEPNTTMYINSTTDPFNEEMEIQEKKLNAWLEHFGILKTETIHSSGHCCTDDLVDALKKINADNVIPIHTEHADTFEQFGLSGDIVIPEIGKKYSF